MNSRPEISTKNITSVFASIFGSNSKSYSVNDYESHKSKEISSTSGLELHHVAGDVNNLNNSNNSERPKRGFRMIYLCAMASMCFAVSAGYSTVYAGPATFDMQTRKSSSIKITDDEASWIGSILSIGMMTSIPLAVFLADKIGRKETLVFNSIIFATSWLIIIYAQNPIYVLTGRFLGGSASAVVYVVLPMYAVEISSADTRGLIGASFQACVTIGSLLVMGLGAVLPWSWLAVGGLVAVDIALIFFCPMPESPRWLIAAGMKEKAIEAIEFLHADKIDAKQECQIIESTLQLQTKSKMSIQNLKQPIIYKPALISMGQMVFLQFSGSTVMVLFTSMILHNAHSVLDAKYSTVIFGAVQVIATVLSSLVMDKAGRRVLLLVSGFLMGISQGVLGDYFYFFANDSTVSSKVGWLPLASLLFYVAVFSVGYGPIPWLMLSEMVPTRERGFVSGTATLLTSVLAFVATKTFEDLRNLIKFHGVFWTYSAFCFLSCLFVYFLVPETKGKQLEEIQLIFSGQQTDVPERDTKGETIGGIDNLVFSNT